MEVNPWNGTAVVTCNREKRPFRAGHGPAREE